MKLKMANIFHRWWNPHCPDCREEREYERHNPTVEILQAELDRLTRANERLLIQLTAPLGTEKRGITREEMEVRPVRNTIPWRVKQHMLEEDDRAKARILREQAQKPTITQNDLDKEIAALNRDNNG